MLQFLANSLSSPMVHGPLLFLILQLLSRIVPKGKRVYQWLSCLPILWVFFCSLVYPSVLLIKPLEDQYPTVKISSKLWQNADAIVVLACNHFDDEGLPFVSRWPQCTMQRNLHAALMYKEKHLPIHLAAGILNELDSASQAHYNKTFLITLGVSPNDIYTHPQGHDTESEVDALAPHLKNKYVALVTSASHLPRAVQYFDLHGIKVLPIPVEHLSRKNVSFTIGLPNAFSLYRSERAIHEYLGLIYQRYIK
ncbi:YdcF family protein [Paraglaciecola agarilytica]|uniref:YdcF family protein n=1 Tax=Paraglaciecola chathamensis TaxID=368405 RepID=UPI001C0A1BAC|nr:YdcF family protein [Paraglaciecola agarilytica]MBU3017196.1 YdcF family protein [Paraglaciecola agarilytica]